MTKAKIELPPKLIPVFSADVKYRGAWGGRGSGKTRAFALMSAVRGYMFAEAGMGGQIVCAREHLNSLDESSMEEVKQAIRAVPFLNDYYDIGEKYIRTKNRLVNYAFAGLRHNLDSFKSKARILILWVDEAEPVSEIAWRKAIPTVREEQSEIWLTWNRESEESATNKRFLKSCPESSRIVELNWRDNPWFPETLNQERLDDQKNRPETYDHIWEGGYLTITDAQVFRNKFIVDEFKPESGWDGPYFGVDFGFAQDPTTAVKCWVANDCLYVEKDCGKVGLEIDETADYIKRTMPEIESHYCRADSARPESISYLKRHGLRKMQAVKKWQGSVEDGVEFIKSFKKVIIHPSCTATAREFRLYSFKIDQRSGDILPVIVDDHNHYIDAIRYALAPLIQNKGKPVQVQNSGFGY